MTTTSCPNCGKPLRPGARFCGNCGHTIPATPSAQAGTPPSPARNAVSQCELVQSSVAIVGRCLNKDLRRLRRQYHLRRQ
jgi:uncharacterized Zn finger protein (UPF0148 family)